MIHFVNKAELVGEVGIVRIHGTGPTRCVRLTMNTQTSLRRINDEDSIQLTWHSVTIWCNSVRNFEDVTLIQKGAVVRVLGRISNRKYVDKEGISRTATDIIANKVEILGNGVSPMELAKDDGEECAPVES